MWTLLLSAIFSPFLKRHKQPSYARIQFPIEPFWLHPELSESFSLSSHCPSANLLPGLPSRSESKGRSGLPRARGHFPTGTILLCHYAGDLQTSPDSFRDTCGENESLLP